jgi:tetratricopeptide (TPR) repeat protein
MRLYLNFCAIAALALCAALPAAQDGPVRPAGYVPEPEIEDLIKQAADKDKTAAQKAIDQLSAKGAPAERALQWHIAKESTPAACVKWAELYARCNFGRTGFKVNIELQPDGSGTVTLWSDRTAIADCGKRYARMRGQAEPVYDDEELRRNPFSKVELLKYLSEGVKYLEGGVQPNKDGNIEARGVLGFKNFDAFSEFAESFDPGGIFMLAGSSLTDERGGVRTFRYRKSRETDRNRIQENTLLFYGVRWQYELDFKGKVGSNNAQATSGSALVWHFNCYQMMRAEALVEASYDNTGLTPRPAADDAAQIPSVVQANQPVAVVRNREVKVKVYSAKADGTKPSVDELRKLGQLVELDASQSLPGGETMRYQWTQTMGSDLNLSKDSLAKKQVFLIIKEAGEYRFELTVSNGETYSKPTEVRISVEDPRAAVKLAPPVTPVATAHKNTDPPKETVKPETPPKETPRDTPKETVQAPNETPRVSPKETPPKETVQAPKESPRETPRETVKPTDTSVKPDETTADPAKYDPVKSKELHAKGVAEFKAGRLAEAKTLLSEAHALDPEQMELKFDLAVVLMDLGEVRDALSKFEDVASKTRNSRAYMNVGHCYARLNNLGQARTFYIEGSKLGKDAVAWEPTWQLGHKKLRLKEYESALNLLKEAEEKAAAAKVSDYRLVRDMAAALHGNKQSAEALKKLDEYQKLGFTPDPVLLAEVKKASGATAPTEVKPIDPVKPVDPIKPIETAKPTPPKEAPPKETAPKEVANVKPQPRATEPIPPAPDVKTPAREPAPPIEPKKIDPPVEQKKPPKRPKPVVPKRPIPPVPADFKQAMEHGLRALEAGKAAAKEAGKNDTDEAKIKSVQDFEEAEAMFRGAWILKPAEPELVKAFQELADHAGAVALVEQPLVKAKANGLVVLNAEPSVGPQGKPLYFSWRQVDGEDLGLRPEQLAEKKVGLRIPKAGTYKFDIAVSDGIKGGSPITVTVEVIDSNVQE